MEQSERDLRNPILQLIQAHKLRQLRAAALQVLCPAALEESATRPVTIADLRSELPKIEVQLKPEVDAEARPLEDALIAGEPFLGLLRSYASQQFQNPRPRGTTMNDFPIPLGPRPKGNPNAN
jgi:hypothetical protein